MPYYYVKYSGCGRLIIDASARVAEKSIADALGVDAIACIAMDGIDYGSSPKVFNLPKSKIAKIKIIFWGIRTYPDERKRLSRILTFKIFPKKIK